MRILLRSDFDLLLDALRNNFYKTIGPTLRDGAIVYDEINSSEDFPIGWTDKQDAGKYRLEKRNDEALFGYVVGPQSWKKFLNPPVQKIWQAEKTENKFDITPEKFDETKFAFIGVRSCELNAIFIQDKVFTSGEYVNQNYKLRRDNTFIVAVNCVESGGTCFCVSMNTGPKAEKGFDISLTEIVKDGNHHFLAESGSDQGEKILSEIPHRSADQKEIDLGNALINNAAASMQRVLDTSGIRNLLMNNLDHPQWDKVAERCLSCANCTMVCPTCFCTTVEDTTDLTGEHAERWQKWDSCFTIDFSYIHGGSIRNSVKSRYRQWMTHKLATWYDQFGTSGCVGCGRCITWCPVGIDITEEVRAIKEASK